MSLVVQKFGGTSVGSAERIRAVAAHVAQTASSGKQVVVVVSAMGEHTDELLSLAKQISQDPPRREVDMLLTAGERISMALLSMALHERKVPATSLTGSQSGILTDDNHGNARITRILGDRIRAGLQRGNVVIVAGFQGMSPNTKEITTLGRGGSDLSAVALAVTLKAELCEIYKDVDGVFSADPRLVSNVRQLRHLSWNELLDLTWYGAAVFHSRGATLAKKCSMPLHIRSSFNFDLPGTRVGGDTEMESPRVDALTHVAALTMMQLKIAPADLAISAITRGRAWLWERGQVSLVSQLSRCNKSDQVNIAMLVPDALAKGFKEFLNKELASNKARLVDAGEFPGLTCVTLVGVGFWQSPELVGSITSAIGSAAQLIDVRHNSMSICVKDATARDTMQKLHERYIENPSS